MERIAVSASYEAVQGGKPVAGRIEFVARVADASKGYDLVYRISTVRSWTAGLVRENSFTFRKSTFAASVCEGL